MAISEVLQGVGSWSVRLRPDTPAEIVDELRAGAFGHIAVTAGREDVRVAGDSLLRSARYNGVLRGLSRTSDSGYEISGPGMKMWLGDEDGKGAVFEEPVAFNGVSFKSAVEGLLAATDGAVVAGTITDTVEGTYSRVHQYESARAALDYLCSTLPGEYRVNGDATLDAGTIEELYGADPTAAVVAKTAGVDGLLRAIGGSTRVDQDFNDFTTRTVLLGSTTTVPAEGGESETTQFISGTADIAPELNPYTNLHGGVLKLTRLITESATSSEETAEARAQLALNRFTSPRRSVTLSTDQYDVRGDVQVGAYLWCYDPDTGLVDETNEVHFRGERIAPVKLRCTKLDWPVTDGMGVAFRTRDGRWLDLTDYVEFERGETRMTVGGYDRALTSTGESIVSGRAPVADASVPDVPAFVTPFVQGVYRAGDGSSRAQVQVQWTQPTNTDGSTIVDGGHYELRYRTAAGSVFPTTWAQAASITWNTASGQPWGAAVPYVPGPWHTVYAPFDEQSFLLSDLAVNTEYQVQIRAVDLAVPPNYGAWSDPLAFQTVVDTVPPVTPAPPDAVGNTMAVMVTHTLGAASGGTYNLDLDTVHLDVYAGSDPTFTPTEELKIGEMPANAALLRAHVPSVKTFPLESTDAVFIKVVAVDEAGNRSAASDSVEVRPGLIPAQFIQSLTAEQITSGEVTASLVLAGEIATSASATQGMHMDALGLRGYRPDGQLAFRYRNYDGSMYVLGEYRTALTGQRLVINENGATPDSIRVYPNGSGDYARIAGRTAPWDGSAAILIDGGATSATGRGRLGAYKSEAFVSWVASDNSGSLTAVSCTDVRINVWTQDSIYLYKASGTTKLAQTDTNFFWASGTLTRCFVISTPDSGVGLKFDSNTLLACGDDGQGFMPFKCSALTQTSSEEAKTDIAPVREVLTPLDVLERAPARAWRYAAEVERLGEDAPLRFGPLAEDLPDELVWMTPDGAGGLEKSIELGSMVGAMWGMLRQLQARRITSTTATCTLEQGTTLRPGETVEVACTWESSPLATPTDAMCFLNVGLIGSGRVTAWVRPGSVDANGCTVVFKNIGSTSVTAARASGALTSVSATVIGQALYTPDVDY